ncbi:hypothetical protein [Spirosoma flavum]|uniref:Uncharacterized protein n=1 Tax=Spirosoma flavum TaxID=2048557 RepID=A0ABW6ASA0_9BACT
MDLPTFHLTQYISISSESTTDSAQLTSFVDMSGFTGGVSWSPRRTSVDILSDQRIHYSAVDLVEWRLLNFLIYSQLQNFKGDSSLDSLKNS